MSFHAELKAGAGGTARDGAAKVQSIREVALGLDKGAHVFGYSVPGVRRRDHFRPLYQLLLRSRGPGWLHVLHANFIAAGVLLGIQFAH